VTGEGLFADAVRDFWRVRAGQAAEQASRGGADQGARSQVTGGKHLDGLLLTLISLLEEAGVPSDAIHVRTAVTYLPGFFRPTKRWDLLVVHDEVLRAAVELKAQVGPSFGNNFNNRVEEAIGNAEDLWTAYREGAFGDIPAPFLGYLFLLEDAEGSRRPVEVKEPHYDVFPEFRAASYALRYELFLRRLVRERKYTSTCLLLSEQPAAPDLATCDEPAADLGARQFLSTLVGAVR
jgi:hypothetical protein